MISRRPASTAIFSVALLAILNSCATTKPATDVRSATANTVNNVSKVEVAKATENEKKIENAADQASDEQSELVEVNEVEDALVTDVEDAEFCKDNIYARYLRDQYLKANSKANRPELAFKPSARAKRRGVPTRSPYDAREVEALFYARSRLVGNSVPYFGAIPVVTNPRVEHWVRYFKNNGRRAFLRWLVRGESVKPVVLPILKDQGLPPEFIFLSMVESGFSNSAYSRAKATGPWQFMPATAKLYGLNMNPWIDERRDPGKSTLAAAKLLSALYQEFGDWYLAMAAYNAGSGRVRSAIRKTKSTNFWDLADSPYLPVETKNYVPKVLAALMLASNPAAHGFNVIGDPLDSLPVSLVEVSKPVALQEVADHFNVTERLIRHWNPELISAVTPPGRNPYKLRLAPHLVSKWDDVSDKLTYLEFTDVLMHKIRRGDTLRSIASRYRVDVRKILSANPGLKAGKLKIGAEVAVPALSVAPTRQSSKMEKPKKKARAG